MVEDQKKEDRLSGNSEQKSMSWFLKNYNQSELFMVQDVYDHMLKDVKLPEIINCEEMWEVSSSNDDTVFTPCQLPLEA